MARNFTIKIDPKASAQERDRLRKLRDDMQTSNTEATTIAANTTSSSANTTSIATNTTAIALNTTHSSSDGKDHSDVVLNNTHRTGNGADHANVATNTTHSGGDGSDHSDVALNTLKVIDNTAYDATSWNGNSDAATKDAIRDKIEAISVSSTNNSLGTLLCHMNATMTGTFNAGEVIQYDTEDYQNGDLTFATGTYTATLIQDKTYEITAAASFNPSTATIIYHQIYDKTNAAYMGRKGNNRGASYSSDTTASPLAFHVVKPITNVDIDVRIESIGSGHVDNVYVYGYLYIREIPDDIIVPSGDSHTIASHNDTSVTGVELTTVEGRVDQDLKTTASPSFVAATLTTGNLTIGDGAMNVSTDSGNQNNNFRIYSTTSSHRGLYNFSKYGGTLSVPAACQTGDRVGEFSAKGSTDGSSTATVGRLAFDVETFTSSTDLSGNIKFSTRPDGGGASLTERMRITGAGYVGIGLTPTSNMDGLSIESGLLTLKETTTPTADTNYGKVYTKSDNKLYFQDGGGTEHEIAFV